MGAPFCWIFRGEEEAKKKKGALDVESALGMPLLRTAGGLV
jgi:hypothetical protein